ncbi:unnamed protein product [Chrysoparadoxa australica]
MLQLRLCAAAFTLLAWAAPSFAFCIAPRSVAGLRTMSTLRMSSEDWSDEQVTRKQLLNKSVTTAIAAGGAWVFRRQVVVGAKALPHDMTGKNVIITGGNVGLGKEAAIALVKMGASVVIGCRNEAKAQAATEEIAAAAAADGPTVGSVKAMTLDLSSTALIKAFADQYSKKANGPLDVLMNNAGVMAIPEKRITSDGFEQQLGINHIGHFYLTSLLLPLMKKSKDARVVNVSSEAHKILPKIRFNDPNWDEEYSQWGAYGQSKTANILFARELQRRCDAAGLSMTSMSLHPGACRTNLGRYLFDPDAPVNPLLYPVIGVVLGLGVFFTKSATEGAQTQIRCAVDPDLKSVGGGRYFVECEPATAAPETSDETSAAKLWALTEQLLGKKFEVKA